MFEDSKLILFFSADIVGSTAVKVKRRSTKPEESWKSIFEGFYEEFPKAVNKYISEKNSQIDIWKFNGDEILFKKEINKIDQVRIYIKKYEEAIKYYNNLEIMKSEKLALKGTIWLAGFPVINMKILGNSKFEDYIGPSIDAGFRLCKYSTPNKLIISLETAYILTDKAIQKKPKLNIYYWGNEVLKGVLNSKPYPIFWIDTANEVEKSRKILSKEKPSKNKDIFNYINKFIEQINDPTLLVKPYIYSKYGEPHKEHEKILKGLNAKQDSLKEKIGTEESEIDKLLSELFSDIKYKKRP